MALPGLFSYLFWHAWTSTPFDWWKCQLNFALWCAGAGCGVSFEDHLQATDLLLRGLYTFHVYYTTRGILEELRVALPRDLTSGTRRLTMPGPTSGSAPSSECQLTQTGGRLDNGCQGLGSYSTYMEPSGAYRHSHQAQGPFFHLMDANRHYRDISRAWTTFILDNSNGFTRAGVHRLIDSIRTYIWAILGAQYQTRSNILKAGTVFDAQGQFVSNVEDAIASPVDIPALSENAPVCINPPGLYVWNWALPVTERHGTPSRKHPGL